MAAYVSGSPEKAVEVIAAKADMDGSLMPILHALVDTFGYVPDEAVPLIAGALNLSRAEVHGVLTFYHDFRREPPPVHLVRLCRAEACQARGGEDIAAGLAVRGTPQGVAVEAVYCLGLCASGP